MFVAELKKARRVQRRKSTEYLLMRSVELALLHRRTSNEATRKLYWGTVPRVLQARKYDVEEYTDDIDPFQVFQVDPAEISKLTGREYPHQHKLKWIGSVRGGEWDRRQDRDIYPSYPYDFYNAERFEETVLYQSLRERFVDEVPWSDTEIVRRVTELIDQGHSVWHGCSSEADLRDRCAALDELHDSMRTAGYRPSSELNASHGLAAQTVNEIAVDIGRDGDLLFADGRHRLAIAKMLDLDTVPVMVLVRHRGYMESRKSQNDVPLGLQTNAA